MTAPSALSEQVLAIPSGAGGVSGLGETFAADPYTGTGRFRVPITAPPGHAGLGPTLALVYSSGAGAGVGGVGWSFGAGSVRVRTEKGIPTYGDGDVYLLGDDELVPLADGYFVQRSEGAFSRIRHVKRGRDDFWAVTDRSGVRRLYGRLAADRDGEGLKTSAWHLSEIRDTNNNVVTFTHERDEDGNRTYLTRVDWAGGIYRIVLTYEDRPDVLRSARAGYVEVTDRRIKRIDVQVKRLSDDALTTFDSYALSYSASSITGLSLLTSVTRTGTGADSTTRTWPTLSLGYTTPGAVAPPIEVTGHAGRSLADPDLTLADMTGDGLPDLLESTNSGYLLRRNLGGGRFASPFPMAGPTARLREQGVFLSDLAGEGFPDLVTPEGFYPNEGAGFGGFRAFKTRPSFDLEDPDARFVDLDGDGLGDVLVTQGDQLTFFRYRRGGAWDPAKVRPLRDAPLPRLSDPWTRLADMEGDGLADLVRLTIGGVEVYQNLGHGRFAPVRRLGLPERLPRDTQPSQLQLVDLTGTGAADLLVRMAGEVWIFPNGCGERFGNKIVVRTRPLREAAAMEPVDLLGTAVKGILYTEAGDKNAWTFYRLWDGVKPDVLKTVTNGMGAETAIRYGSSVLHAARDAGQGRRWRYPLPYAAMVVEEITSTDTTTGNRVGQRFTYHEGYHDAAEREFRGFGIVEQWDTESFAKDTSTSPPSRTVRFFDLGNGHRFRDRYFPMPAALPDEVIPNAKGARRALRGMLLREEVYGEDGTVFATRPYTLSHHAYTVKIVAGPPSGGEGSFFAARTTTELFHLERSYDYRRMRQTFAYDALGRLVEQREKGFGRRGTFSAAHEDQQTADLERYTETAYLALDDAETDDYDAAYVPTYLVDRPSLVESYGVTGTGDVLLSRERMYYDGTAYEGLGYPGSGTTPGVTKGRLSAKLALAFTDDLIDDAYPVGSGAETAFSGDGDYLTVGTDHYIRAERHAYNSKGLITGTLDPRGNGSTFTYDEDRDLFPWKFTDAAGHPTELTRGEFPHQVVTVKDANDNETEFAYDPTGLPASKSVKGKEVESAWQGDPTTHPTEVYEYDFATTPIEITVKTRQERLGATFDVRRYVDGLGRTIQERHTAEPDPQDQGNPPSARYRVTGWQVFNHKGLVVKAYQPNFATSLAYAAGSTTTAFVETLYDPLGRPVRVNYPDGTFETTEYHPWVQAFRDRNDNAGAITKADTRYGGHNWKTFQGHLDTPTRKYVDAFGREIAVSEDNGTGVEVRQTFRVTTYEITGDEFSGTTYSLELDHPLAKNYFVQISGGVGGTAPNATDSGVRITKDPHGTGDLDVSAQLTGRDVLFLQRLSSAQGAWRGSVTVWECLGDESTSGFRLVDVKTVSPPSLSPAATPQSVTETTNFPWTTLSRVALYGGPRGGGATVATSAGSSKYPSICGKLTPSGTGTITLERWSNTVVLDAATFTVYVVEWGSEHTIQRVTLTGTAGTSPIGWLTTSLGTSIAPEHTWCTMSGWTKGNVSGTTFFGLVLKLGDSSSVNGSQVSVGSGASVYYEAEVIVHTHESFAVDWISAAQDTSGATTKELTVDGPLDDEYREGVAGTDRALRTRGHRAAVHTTTCEDATAQLDRALWRARHTAATTLYAERQEGIGNFSTWAQSIDASAFDHTRRLGSDGYERDVLYTDDPGVPERSSIRITQYEITGTAFSGTEYDLVLEQPLAPNYFAQVMGLHVDAISGGYHPNSGAARVNKDPHGNFSAGSTSAPNVLQLKRAASAGGAWQGTVIVWESLADHDASGFTLVDVVEAGPASQATQNQTQTHPESISGWNASDAAQIALYGGPRGGGSTSSAGTGSLKWGTVVGRLTLNTSTGQVVLDRHQKDAALDAAVFAVYVVKWGDEHHIERVTISGTSLLTSYDSATISSVVPENTWCFMSGYTEGKGGGPSFWGTYLELSDSTTVRIAGHSGITASNREVAVTVHEHPSYAVCWKQVTVENTTATSVQAAVTAAEGAEEYGTTDSVNWTTGNRGGLWYHTLETPDTNTNLSFGIWRTRQAGSGTLQLVRQSGATYGDCVGWVQSIDAARIRHEARRYHVTRSVLDLKDQVTEVWDARELAAPTWKFGHDLAGRRITSEHTTALGTRYALADAAGNPIWARDARGIEVTRVFDALNRPTSESTDDGTAKLRRMWTYVAYSGTDSASKGKNLFGRVEEERDADGIRFFEYDHRGLVTKASHKFWGHSWDSDSADMWASSTWDPAIPSDARTSGSLTWLELTSLDSNTTTVEVTTTYDAAGRPTAVAYTGDMETRNAYNAAGQLEAVEADRYDPDQQTVVTEDVISGCRYNARGQLEQLTHGNGIVTTREYDADIERLTRITSKHDVTSLVQFQDLEYDYDPVGNPLKITDHLHDPTYRANLVVGNTRTFRYDPRYRLIGATGKKLRSIGLKSVNPYEPTPAENEYEPYEIQYRYDEVGNFLRNQEYSRGPVHYKAGRIDLFNGDGREAVDDDPEAGNFTYDENGNTTKTPTFAAMKYTHDNQPRYVNLTGGGEVRYLRHGDQRVVRFVKKNGVRGVSVYLGPYEYHQRTGTGDTYAKLVLHVNGHGRHAQLERLLSGSDSQHTKVFYSLGDHLGSGHVLTDADPDAPAVLSQEEYFPYGRSSDRRDTRNRYRYIGVERDEDTGLCMTGPRTYDPVSGRFLQGDPIAVTRGGITPFHYASGNPARRSDPGGYEDLEASEISLAVEAAKGLRENNPEAFDAFMEDLDASNPEAYDTLTLQLNPAKQVEAATQAAVEFASSHAATSIFEADGIQRQIAPKAKVIAEWVAPRIGPAAKWVATGMVGLVGAMFSAYRGPPSSWIKESSKFGGHLHRHVARTDRDLATRLKIEQIPLASTFESASTAETVLNSWYFNDNSDLDHWLDSNPHKGEQMEFTYNFGEPIGRVMNRRGDVEPAQTVDIVVRAHPGATPGFYVHTVELYPP